MRHLASIVIAALIAAAHLTPAWANGPTERGKPMTKSEAKDFYLRAMCKAEEDISFYEDSIEDTASVRDVAYATGIFADDVRRLARRFDRTRIWPKSLREPAARVGASLRAYSRALEAVGRARTLAELRRTINASISKARAFGRANKVLGKKLGKVPDGAIDPATSCEDLGFITDWSDDEGYRALR